MLFHGDYPSCTIVVHKAVHSYRIEEGRIMPFVGEIKALQGGKIEEALKMQKLAISVLDCTTVDHY